MKKLVSFKIIHFSQRLKFYLAFFVFLLFILSQNLSGSDVNQDYLMIKSEKKNVYNIIPLPKSLLAAEGRFEITNLTSVAVSFSDAAVKKIAENLIRQIQLTSSKQMQLVDILSAPEQNVIRFEMDAALASEGYSMQITPTVINIKSATSVGAFYALQTFYQLLPAGVYGSVLVPDLQLSLPCVMIDDEPRLKYRGMHLDVARYFMPIEFIKQYIDVLSMYKINHFHWHLTDDQGWRIEIKKYPKLTEIGAVRSETMIGYTGKYDGKEHRGFYTQEQAKEVVAYAAERFITVIPEIEMPGHAVAAQAAYPELSCNPNEKQEVAKNFGVFLNLMCPKESTFSFLEDVFTELFEIFPATYYHIGGDECNPLKSSWHTCVHCQALMKNEGLADEVALQNYFVNRIAKFLNGHRKQIIGWNEILKGGSGLPSKAVVMSWTGGSEDAIRLNHKVIMTPWQYCYLDYYQAGEELEKADNACLGGFLPLEKVYNYNPVSSNLSSADQTYIYGVQGNLWTEFISTTIRAMYQVFPRALAISEIGWTQQNRKDYNSFRTRVAANFPKLQEKKIAASAAFYSPIFTFVKDAIYPKSLKITLDYPTATIHYTLDGTEPNELSVKYTSPLSLPKGTVIKAVGYEDGKRVGNVSGIWFGDNSYFLLGKYDAGDGSVEYPYEISNKYQLDEVRKSITSHFKLTENIDLTNMPFAPIGSIMPNQHFAGYFDGNGHSIENAEINGGGWIGFFGTGKNCTIKNLFLKNLIVKASSDYAGGLIGYIIGGNISNCAVTGKIIPVGNATNNYGGIVGLIADNPVTISDCYVDMELSPNSGAAGIASVVASSTAINRCIVKGRLISGNKAAAAISIAKSANVSVSNMVIGNLIIEQVGTSGKVGFYNRVIAENRISVSLNNNFADGDKTLFVKINGKNISSGQATTDGLTKSTSELQRKNTYINIGYQFGNSESAPWIIEEGKNYPTLWYMNNDGSTSEALKLDDNHLKVYPVPCTDVLHIDGLSVICIELYDMLGNLIGRYNTSSIDLTQFHSGPYLLKIRTDKGGDSCQIVKL